MDICQKMLLLLFSMLPFAAATFFPFTSFRPPSFPHGYRPQRTGPPTNLVSVQSPILGLRVYVPRELLGLFNGFNGGRPSTFGPDYQPPNYPRSIPFNPHPNYPHENRPNEYPHLPPNYSPNLPPFDANAFIHLMRALYPDMIYRPNPRYPNVFALRFPRELPPYPDLTPPQPSSSPDYYPEQNRIFPGEFSSDISQFLEPPPNYGSPNLAEQNQSSSYNQPHNNQQPHNHLLSERKKLFPKLKCLKSEYKAICNPFVPEEKYMCVCINFG
ncbi:early nodulin-75-like [Contarinia nasturtii]|uniref:early nodulin-75-like n=1 Tax=Contarinia nasturtii TaxID=265458 RepID=UPI0012D49FAC|nr:early nodulin-75-like [Contarinia nasturtii]